MVIPTWLEYAAWKLLFYVPFMYFIMPYIMARIKAWGIKESAIQEKASETRKKRKEAKKK